jgi:hypothetical protein
MSLFQSSFSSLNTNEKQTVDIELIDGVYVPLKDEKTVDHNGVAKVGNMHSEEGFEFKDILHVKQHTDNKMMDDLHVRHLVLNDTLTARIFIGGTSIFGLYVLYNLLYNKK